MATHSSRARRRRSAFLIAALSALVFTILTPVFRPSAAIETTGADITAVRGSGTLSGPEGGNVSVAFNVTRFWILPLFVGSIRVSDPTAGLSLHTPVLFPRVTSVSGNGASSASTWFSTRQWPWRAYRLDWTVRDRSDIGGVDEIEITIVGGTSYEVEGALDSGDIDVMPDSDAGTGECPDIEDGEEVAVVANGALSEISGVAASRLNADVLWVHNDSGDGPNVYAMTTEGTHLGAYTLQGATARDWEDIAIGPGPDPGVDYLYVADIGDNNRVRSHVTIYRVPEPTVDATTTVGAVSLTDVDALEAVYPDGPHNAETLLADPVSGDLFIVTKALDGDSQVFRHPTPHDGSATATLEEAARLTFGIEPLPGFPASTGGDISPEGDAILIRTYSNAFVWNRPAGTSVATALERDPCPAPLRAEPQGEAIGFAADGRAYYSISESVNPPIYRYPLAIP